MAQFNEYVADGTTRLFAYRFPAFEKADIQVSLNGISQISGWTPLGLGGGNGGAIEFDNAPVAGTIIRIARINVPPQVAYLVRDENLADVQDKAEARTNLGVYSTTQTDAAVTAAAGTVQASSLQKSANLSDVADAAQARTNLGVYSTAQTDAAINAAAGTVQASSLQKSANLSDVADVAQARTNLGVYSTAQTDAAVTAAAGTAQASSLQKSANLSDVADVAQARTNLGVYSTAQTDAAVATAVNAAISSNPVLESADDRIARLERNLAITVLRSQIDTGWSALKMVDGVSDEFEDLAGIGSSFIAEAAVPHWLGTAIGDMTASGGVAAAFDGGTSQLQGVCSRIPSTSSSGWVGKDWGAGTTRIVTKAIVTSPSDTGFGFDSLSPLMGITLQGSNDGSTWTSLAAEDQFNDATTSQIVRTVTASTFAPYRYHRVSIRYVDGRSDWVGVCEVQFFEKALTNGAVHDSAGSYIHNPGIVTVASSQSAWTGATSSYTFSGDDLDPFSPGSVRTVASFAGDFEFSATLTSSHGFGVYGAADDASFNQTQQHQGAIASSFWVEPNQGLIKYGLNQVKSQSIANGSRVALKRVGSTLSVLIGGITVHTFSQTYSGPMRFWVGAGSPDPYYTDVAWMTDGDAVDITIASATTSAKFQPSQSRLVLLHQPVGTVTLNTDVSIEASRDGGSTWTAGTLVDVGSFDAATNILSALVDLSGQPAGSAMCWRYKTFNAKEQRLHGVWMQWR